MNHTGTRSKPVRTRALEVEVEEEEEEMDNQGMNGHDSSSEKRGADDNQEGEGMLHMLACLYFYSYLCVNIKRLPLHFK